MHALIIGGGIAGAGAALALRMAGVDCTIFECHAEGADDRGAFLTLMPNGMRGLRALDAHRRVERAAFPARTLTALNGDGEVQFERRLDDDEVQPCTLTRADLYRALHAECAERGIAVVGGKRLDSARTAADGVRARFDDGTSADGDLLIGADGVWSTLRGQLDPANPRPRYVGLNVVYGYARQAPAPVPEGYRMIRGKHAHSGQTTDPTGTTWWFARLPLPERSPQELAAMTSDDWRELAASFVDGDASPAADVIRASTGGVLGINTYDLPSVPTWHTARAVLVGDAAHAMSPAAGQGASQAVEDAVMLGKCLRDCTGLERAFATCAGLRRSRVEAIVAGAAAQSANPAARAPARPRPDDAAEGGLLADWRRPITAAEVREAAGDLDRG